MSDDIYWEISKLISAKERLKFRLVSSTFDRLVMGQVYNRNRITLFRNASSHGDILTLTKVYHYYQNDKLIQKELLTLRNASNHLPVIQQLYGWASDEIKLWMLSARGCESFRHACRNGHINHVRAFYGWASADIKLSMLTVRDCEGFRLASGFGHLAVVQQLYEWASVKLKSMMLSVKDYDAFSRSAENGHLGVIKQLYEWLPEEQRYSMIAAGDYRVFRSALNHPKIEEELYDWASPEQRDRMDFEGSDSEYND